MFDLSDSDSDWGEISPGCGRSSVSLQPNATPGLPYWHEKSQNTCGNSDGIHWYRMLVQLASGLHSLGYCPSALDPACEKGHVAKKNMPLWSHSTHDFTWFWICEIHTIMPPSVNFAWKGPCSSSPRQQANLMKSLDQITNYIYQTTNYIH